MGNNSMQTIMFKILTYLNRCFENGKIPNIEDIKYYSPMMNVSESAWSSVMKDLADNGYIDGVFFQAVKQAPVQVGDRGIRITFKGVEFLEENSLMSKTKEFLGRTYDDIVQGLVSGLVSR